MKSFIVESWSKIFSILRWISLFQVVRWVVCKKFSATSKICRFVESYGFVELWVLGHVLLSIILLLIYPTLGAVIYGGLRVFEVLIYLINVILFDEYRANKAEHRKKRAGETYAIPYAIRGYRRIVILLLHNYAEIILWFALFYRHWDWAFETGRASLNSFFDALNFSFATITKFGYTTIYPRETSGDILVFIQSGIGLFMVLLILARFISLIPKPKTMDEFER